MNTDTSIRFTRGFKGIAVLAVALLPVMFGCSPETTENSPEASSPGQSSEEAHGHDHPAEDEDHGHEHAEEDGHDDDHGHSHETATTDLSSVDDILHSIASNHEMIENAVSDEALLEVHHTPFEIRDLFQTLRPMLGLSDEDGQKYDALHDKIGKQADLIEKHSHDKDIAMVRTLVEKLNQDIEALERIAAPNHAH